MYTRNIFPELMSSFIRGTRIILISDLFAKSRAQNKDETEILPRSRTRTIISHGIAWIPSRMTVGPRARSFLPPDTCEPHCLGDSLYGLCISDVEIIGRILGVWRMHAATRRSGEPPVLFANTLEVILSSARRHRLARTKTQKRGIATAKLSSLAYHPVFERELAHAG